MSKRFPAAPRHPERVCWGCDRYCAANSMACGNGSERTQHPVELFGDDWLRWSHDGRPPGEADGTAASGLQAARSQSSRPSPGERVRAGGPARPGSAAD